MRRVAGALVCAGALALPAQALATGWVYTESNNPIPGHNSVLALQYGPGGVLSPINVREYPTRGTGAALILGKSAGVISGDHEVQLSSDKRWLFAVNQGSNTIAVFRVNQATGALVQVPGSPFSSGGVAPISVGYSRGRLVVANHGQLAPFDPAGMIPPGPASFTSFTVSRAGRLRLVSTIPAPHEGLTDASVSPFGGQVFSTGFYSQKIHALTFSKSGSLAEAPGSPTQFPPSMNANVHLPPFIPAALIPIPFGIAVHPSKPYVYISGPLNFRIAIYRYDAAGSLTFVGQVENPGAVAACWAVVSKDGRYLYVANSATQDISLFDVSPNGAGLTFVERVKLPSTGTVRELAFGASGRVLYASAGHDDPDGPRPQGVMPDGTIVDAPADGNFIDAFAIGAGGRLRTISSTALPVRFSQLPYGLATLH
jgi:6-phosphogluconolactonase (cycloisomerase 2 family)